VRVNGGKGSGCIHEKDPSGCQSWCRSREYENAHIFLKTTCILSKVIVTLHVDGRLSRSPTTRGGGELLSANESRLYHGQISQREFEPGYSINVSRPVHELQVQNSTVPGAGGNARALPGA
jgi:hypothetical protein